MNPVSWLGPTGVGAEAGLEHGHRAVGAGAGDGSPMAIVAGRAAATPCRLRTRGSPRPRARPRTHRARRPCPRAKRPRSVTSVARARASRLSPAAGRHEQPTGFGSAPRRLRSRRHHPRPSRGAVRRRRGCTGATPRGTRRPPAAAWANFARSRVPRSCTRRRPDRAAPVARSARHRAVPAPSATPAHPLAMYMPAAIGSPRRHPTHLIVAPVSAAAHTATSVRTAGACREQRQAQRRERAGDGDEDHGVVGASPDPPPVQRVDPAVVRRRRHEHRGRGDAVDDDAGAVASAWAQDGHHHERRHDRHDGDEVGPTAPRRAWDGPEDVVQGTARRAIDTGRLIGHHSAAPLTRLLDDDEPSRRRRGLEQHRDRSSRRLQPLPPVLASASSSVREAPRRTLPRVRHLFSMQGLTVGRTVSSGDRRQRRPASHRSRTSEVTR